MLDDWPARVAAGGAILCARDQVLSPICVDDAVDAFVRLVEGGHTGVFHVSGPEPVTRLAFLESFIEEASKYREVRPQVIPRSLNELKRELRWRESRPPDCSLSPRKLQAALGHRFAAPREICAKAAALCFGGGAGDNRVR